MFGRLKRKRDEEEAPLVPHGFLWQATDEPGTPDEDQVELAKPATFEDNQSTSEEVAMPANATPQPENAPPRKLGAISPPLQWPSPNIQEIVRHPEARPLPHASQASEREKPEPAIVETPAAKPIVEAPAAIVQTPAANSIAEEVSPSPATPSLVAIARERTRLWSSAVSANLHSARSHCGSFAKTVSSEMARAVASFRTELHDAAERVNIKGRVANAREVAATRLNTLHQQSRVVSVSAGKKLGALQQAATLGTRSGLTKCGERLRAIDFSWAARGFQRARDLKVTVRIPRGDATRITAAVSAMRMPWNRLRQSMNRDSRLWMSMAMAGLSALIALAVVSGSSRYQPGNSLSVVAAHSPERATGSPHVSQSSAGLEVDKAAATAPIATAAQKVVASSTVQPPSSAVPKQSKANPEPTKLATLKSSTPPATKAVTPQNPKRAHFSEDDDYIAKDTYVVYGRNGKPLRH